MFHACIGTFLIEKTKGNNVSLLKDQISLMRSLEKDTSNRFHEIEETEGLPVKRS